jgi:hypothetical protein
MGVDASSNTEIEIINMEIPPEYGFKQIDTAMTHSYIFEETNNSTICDIIAVYLKGQKILHTEAKIYCEQWLNFLMLPAIFISVLSSIFNFIFENVAYGKIIVSSLNASTAFILALVSYLKLDAKAEAHKTSAYKFDKLQSYVEFNSGKILFITSASNDLGKVIQEIENNVREIKETNQFILPEKIRCMYPKLSNINIFAEVKKIYHKEMRIINDLKDIYNDITKMKTEFTNKRNTGTEPSEQEKTELKSLELSQKSIINSFIRLQDEYLKIDNEFEVEMERCRKNQNNWIFYICGCLKA